ncbi:MAG: TonB-dependent receptor plug domain-containing protein, partial [Saprospiraceae bacterium]
SYLGYKSVDLPITSSGGIQSIIMEEDVTKMEEVVVTGLATSVKRSNLANSVASVPAEEISGIVVPTSTQAALYGKFTGVNISANSGAPGGGISFKLRGTTSINGSSQPLFIIDGVYIDNSSIAPGVNLVSRAASGGATQNQDNPSNRLSDIDPYDIEKIEILKGASTAAIYGSRAAG